MTLQPRAVRVWLFCSWLSIVRRPSYTRFGSFVACVSRWPSSISSSWSTGYVTKVSSRRATIRYPESSLTACYPKQGSS
jgi:hypothetical protein